MSTADRKIGFYNFQFQKHGTDQEPYFDKELFKNFIEYIFTLPDTDRIIRNENQNKAISIDANSIDLVRGGYLIKVVFKSCKYHHNPNYMSSIDGTERPSAKRDDEGEKEKTHLCMMVSVHEAEVILEERRSGVTISSITRYLNSKLGNYLKEHELKRNFKLINGVVPVTDFLNELEKMSKVKIAEIYTYKSMLGSDAYNLLDREDAAMKDEILISTTAKPKETLAKRTVKYIYNSITSEDSKVSRIRIYGNDGDGKTVKLDSLLIKKLEYITTDLDADGTVSTASIFAKMMDILGDGYE